MARVERLMQIGQISKQTGMSVDAIRFYERSKLLRPPTRTSGGFRVYSIDDLSTLQFIRNLQTLGFSLGEIREFVLLRASDLRACSEVRKKLDHKLKDIHAKRVALGNLEDELKAVLSKCNAHLRHRTRKDECPVLAGLGKSKSKSKYRDA